MVEMNNNTYNRSIKLKPADVRKQANYKHINNALYAKVNARKATLPKFHVGDKVRIVRKEGTFEKGFTPNWTEEVFTITAVKATEPPTLYRGYAGRARLGNLLRTRASFECAENLPLLKRKKDRVFVKWKGYSSAFNS